MSNSTQYSGARFIPITHEYLIIWKKTAKSLFAVTWDIADGKDLNDLLLANKMNSIKLNTICKKYDIMNNEGEIQCKVIQ